MACADRVAGILKVDSTMAYPEKTSALVAAKNDCAVDFDHVTFSYAGTGAPSLSDITFSAKKALPSESSAVPEAVNPPLWI